MSNQNQLEKAVRSAKASLAVEGLYVTAEEEALILEHLEGKITEEEFHKRALELINK
ncbi:MULTISPECIES: antitoxin VbhA family protein [Bacillus]|uniref:Antitoxin VbhA domain-containing protein n=1 Tax=Bacillus capparidis TaxID=1840411 RepID=A0ABS4CXS8_9BACI|nr:MULTISPECIES: antitoxin VbhA family protein [Bacillus]MBP1082163.1 hypothetical protein [Bacillus capparidis]MED1096777.1 antitoxin VbhA family protein [Bacillus capparidis]